MPDSIKSIMIYQIEFICHCSVRTGPGVLYMKAGAIFITIETSQTNHLATQIPDGTNEIALPHLHLTRGHPVLCIM